MRLNKKVIESAVVALMLVLITTVTAVSSPATEQEPTVEVKNNGIAGVTYKLAALQAETELDLNPEMVSLQKSDAVVVAEAGIGEKEEAEALQEPELTPEEQEWSDKLIANVENASLNVRTQPDENAGLAGKLHKGDRADVVEQLDGWSHIVSGNVDGYVKNDYCLFGTDALNFAKEVCGVKATILTTGLRVRQSPSEESEVFAQKAEGDTLDVMTDAEQADGWVTVNYNGNIAYVKAEYVSVAIGYGTGITIEEEQELIRKAQAEEAAKKKKAVATQNASVAASADDVTLLAALIQCEAGNECYEGQVAVGAVVMNRVRSGAYPSSIYNVIYQSGQFTPAGSGKVASVVASGVSGSCIQAAQQALGGYDNTGGCLYFRNVSSGISGVVIGNHVFF